jgi:uncharacterized protein DUF6644
VTAGFVAAWAHLYNDSKTMSDAVTFVHLAAIVLGGGVAIAADRAALHQALDSDVPFLPPLGGTAVHRWVIVALVAITASGVLMLLADLHTYVTSPLFWVKMGLTLLLVGNGYVRLRAERAVLGGIQSARTRFRSTSLVSLVLWLAILLAGTMMVSAD